MKLSLSIATMLYVFALSDGKSMANQDGMSCDQVNELATMIMFARQIPIDYDQIVTIVSDNDMGEFLAEKAYGIQREDLEENRDIAVKSFADYWYFHCLRARSEG